VTSYHRYDVKEDRTEKIQIVATQKEPVLCALNDFCSTVGMNIMTWSHVYSVFPEHTFLARRQYRLGRESQRESVKHIDKYRRRGWRAMGAMTTTEPASESLRPNGTRWIGDSRSWKLRLDMDSVNPSSTPDFVIEHSYFFMEKIRTTYYKCSAAEYSNHALKYKYTRGVSSAPNTFWGFVGKRLWIMAVAELLKLDPQEHPGIAKLPSMDELMKIGYRAVMEKITKPESWSYIDFQIPNWSREWEVRVLAEQKKEDQKKADQKNADQKKPLPVKAAGAAKAAQGANLTGGVSARGGDARRDSEGICHGFKRGCVFS
jgi:hypothetical protein